jgi:hypothetical protein
MIFFSDDDKPKKTTIVVLPPTTSTTPIGLSQEDTVVENPSQDILEKGCWCAIHKTPQEDDAFCDWRNINLFLLLIM